MPYIENPFKKGVCVICINDNFPAWKTTDKDKSQIGKQPSLYPKRGEICVIDEILGEFIRFDEYDVDDPNDKEFGFCWWKHTHFKLVRDEEAEIYFNEKSNNCVNLIKQVIKK